MDVAQIVTDYGAVLAEPRPFGLVRDINDLPHLKTEIKRALKVALSLTKDAEIRDQFRAAYVCLADFQPLTEWELRDLRLQDQAEGKSDVVLALNQRVADEAEALKEDLREQGFW